MISNSFKRSVAFFSASALAVYGVIFACADGLWGYDYDSSFAPEVYVDRSYSPLFFSTHEMFYGIGYDNAHVSRFNQSMVADWQGYLKEKVNKEDLSYFLLNDSSASAVDQLYGALLKKQKNPLSNSKLNLGDEKTRGFVEFLHYAKVIEKNTTQSNDSWDYENKSAGIVDAKTLAQVEKLFGETKDEFLKTRYWFQTMKGYFYSDNKERVISFFEKTQVSIPRNTLYYRGVSYVAGAYYRKKDYVKSNYLYSQVFNKCEEMRTVAMYNFHPQEQADFYASLALAKEAEEKIALWALFGYYADERQAIQEIYKLNPSTAHLEFLLTRVINKEESRLNGLEVKSAAEYKQKIKTQLSQEVLHLVNFIAKEGKTSKPYLWNMAAGYLNIFDGNHSQASQLFAKAEMKAPKSELSTQQLRLVKLINQVFATSKMDKSTEDKLLAELDWLYKQCPKLPKSEFRFRSAAAWSRKYIASLYQSQHNWVFSELFDRKTDYFRAEPQLESIKAFLSKPNRTPWEQLAQGIYDVTVSDITEYQGVMSVYAGKIDQAIAFMQQSENGKDVELLGNPFNGKIKDCHDCDHAAAQKVKYTKLTFLQKMKEMQANVEKGVDVYNNSLLLANAFYNMTFYGNARVFYSGNIMKQESNFIDEYYQPQLLNCAVAKEYYKKALEAATNAEQKAKCVYMMAKCERNDFYTEKYHNSEDAYKEPEISFLAWDGFKKLKAEYASTRYYKEVINECGYFKKYVGL